MPNLNQGSGRQARRTAVSPSVGISPYTFARKNAALETLGAQLRRTGYQVEDWILRADAIQRHDELVDAELKYGDFVNEHLDAQAKDNDYAGWLKKYEDAHTAKTGEILSGIKSPGAKRDAAKSFESRRLYYSRQISKAATGKITAQLKSRLPALLDYQVNRAAEAGNEKQVTALREELASKLKSYQADGILYDGEVEQYLAKFDEGIEPVRYSKALNNFRNQVMEIPDRKAAEKSIDDMTGVFKREDRNDLLAQINRKFDIADEAAKEKLEADEKAIALAIYAPKTTEELAGVEEQILGTASFDGDTIDKWIGRLNQQITRLKKGAGTPEGAEGEFGQLMYDLVTNPRQVSIDRIGEFKGDPTKMMQAVRAWGDDHPIFTNPAIKFWYDKLNTDIIGKKASVKELERFDTESGKLLDWLLQFQTENKRLPKHAEIEEFYEANITEPGIKEWFGDVWQWTKDIWWRGPTEEFRAMRAEEKRQRAAGGGGTAPSERLVLGEEIERNGRTYVVEKFRESDGMPMLRMKQ